jgi:hypothetical protein
MSSLRPGRLTGAILAILLLLAVAVSDFVIGDFWVTHPMLTATVSALVVVVLWVAVIEVVLSRRSERCWNLPRRPMPRGPLSPKHSSCRERPI